ncbi:MAG: hypothetical protein AABZ60_19615 [Planctomycetota bacterium]
MSNPITKNSETLGQIPESSQIKSSQAIQEQIRSLRKLLDGDPKEQVDTFEYLKKALEEDRSSTRSLFQKI